MNPTTFPIGEDTIVHDLGLSRRQVRSKRGKRGVDWDLVANGRVSWTQAAFDQLRTLAEKSGVPDAGSDADEVSDAPEPPLPPLPVNEVVTVCRRRVVNFRIVLAQRANGDVIKVGLGGSAHLFWHPMRLLVRRGLTDLWHWEGNPDRPHAGRKLPTRKGKW